MPTFRLTTLFAFVCLALPFGHAPAARAEETKRPEILVSAAASLTDIMKEIGRGSGQAPELKFNFGATGALELQIRQGARPALFVGAAPENVKRLAAEGLVTTESLRIWCRNQLALLVRPELAADVMKDVKGSTWSVLRAVAIKRIAVGEPRSVPAGKYAQQLLEREQLWQELQPKFVFADNVRQALAWVEQGEVDAALVYRTDAQKALKARTVALTNPDELRIEYALALTPQGSAKPEARKFYDYLLGPRGRAALMRHGFLMPAP